MASFSLQTFAHFFIHTQNLILNLHNYVEVYGKKLKRMIGTLIITLFNVLFFYILKVV